MRTGDLVELRPPAEILATLDSAGCLDRLPFMPEMLDYFGRSLRVDAQLNRACDTVHGGVRRVEGAVLLEDLRCSGAAHSGCQAQCRLFWKTEWLQPVSATAAPVDIVPDAAYAALEQVARASTTGTADSDASDSAFFSCQATALFRASNPESSWSPTSLVREVTSGNVGVWRFLRVLLRMIRLETFFRIGLIENSPFKTSEVAEPPLAGEPLQPGDLVQIRTRAEIAKTIDVKGRTRGLFFDREMLPYCGRSARVKTKVTRFVDEETGKLVVLASDCYILDGVVCTGDLSIRRWFCPRAIYPWWRESWLQRIDDSGGEA